MHIGEAKATCLPFLKSGKIAKSFLWGRGLGIYRKYLKSWIKNACILVMEFDTLCVLRFILGLVCGVVKQIVSSHVAWSEGRHGRGVCNC